MLFDCVGFMSIKVKLVFESYGLFDLSKLGLLKQTAGLRECNAMSNTGTFMLYWVYL